MRMVDLVEYFSMADAIMNRVDTTTMSRVDVVQGYMDTIDALMNKYSTDEWSKKAGLGFGLGCGGRLGNILKTAPPEPKDDKLDELASVLAKLVELLAEEE